MKKFLPIAMLALATFLAASQAQADTVDGITFSLVNADLTGHPGDVLTWQYSVTNNSGGTIYGNSIDAFAWSSGTGDPTPFDFFGAGIANGASLIGPLYSFDSDPAVANSFNSGIFDLSVLLADGVTTVDLHANYSATITPGSARVPEPSSWILLALSAGFAGLLALRRALA